MNIEREAQLSKLCDILAIDPGYSRRGQGCACVLLGARIERAWFARPEGAIATLPGLKRVIVEQPQIDGRSRGVDPAVLLHLAWVGAMLAGRYAGTSVPITALTPSAWKGSEPKPIGHARLWRRLSDDEREVLGGDDAGQRIAAAVEAGAMHRWPAGKHFYGAWPGHNLLDAAQLALYARGLR